MQHVLRIVQGQQLFTIYRVQLEMCHSTWIDYNQSMLTLEVIRDNDIWHIFIYKDVRKFWFASYGRKLSHSFRLQNINGRNTSLSFTFSMDIFNKKR